MRRVAVTGLGIISCLGNTPEFVAGNLRRGNSGLRFQPDYAERGFRTQVAGIPDISLEPVVPRKWRRFMADGALYAYYAMSKAIHDAGLTHPEVGSPRTGLIIGSGVGSPLEHSLAVDLARTRGVGKVLPYAAPRIMGSSASANLATVFGIQGISFSVSSACASSGHSIGLAADQIRFGRQDIVFAGGAEETAWTTTMPFDAMGVLSTSYKDHTASRPYDIGRDGFVIAGGAGFLVLEEWNHALQRNARIYAELTGVGLASDGHDMVNPDPSGAARTMRMALNEANHPIDYINSHATSTVAGDVNELTAIREVFGAAVPPISSTKGLSGHAIGASAVHEAIYGLLMMKDGFVAGCANIQNLDPVCDGLPIIQDTVDQPVASFLTNSFGFGGTNASLVFKNAGV
ncbi:MAG: beta-ketoacyl-ACP synthase I [Rhodocyclaceae bacterium]|nr:MAG: beta-ketoacyl-ACP synthase I [Rhodocyclaceae bacterium]